jgi:RecB family exonuclease
VIAPRATRLVRVPGLRTLHDAVALLAATTSIDRARRIAVIVPTQGAGDRLRRTLEHLWLLDDAWPTAAVRRALGLDPPPRAAAIVPPALVSRHGLYERLHAALPGASAVLSPLERETLLAAAAGEAATVTNPPFPVRPGLLAEMLAFYDDLQRQHRTVDDLERVLVTRLEASADMDRGAARLLEQTRFLLEAFRGYEARRARSGLVDEHVVRASWLARPQAPGPFDHVIVTVADQAAEPTGLWTTDFDLLTRLGGLARLDVVATETTLAAGFHERLFEALPGIDEIRVADEEARPVLAAPSAEPARFHFLARDREDEVAAIVRRVKAGRVAEGARPPRLDETAVVYDRPLPYLYLARHLFDSARVPFEANDAWPLAAEPFVAAFDLVTSAVGSSFTRATVVALLGSPHFAFRSGEREVTPADVLSLDHALGEAGFLGGAEALRRLAGRWRDRPPPRPRWQRRGRLRAAVEAAALAAADLAPLSEPGRVTSQVDRVLAFLDSHARPLASDHAPDAPTALARAAVRATLVALRRAAEAHGDRLLRFDEFVSIVRRAIEGHTFMSRVGDGGVQLLDRRAARYGRFRDVQLVGLVEGEWLAQGDRQVFYPSFLLRDLGWPAEATRHAAARAAFHDLLTLATGETRVSAFSLEDEAIVRPSPLVEDLDAAGLAVARIESGVEALVFADEALWADPPEAAGHAETEWLDLRLSRREASHAAFHGAAGPVALGPLRVTAVETYRQCPFKYFAAHVLGLEEPADDDPLMSPRERGTFVHRVFEEFFSRWQDAGRGTISPATLDEARGVFAEVAEACLASLPEAERDIERQRLLGSAVAAGFGDRLLAFEASQGVEAIDRRLEVTFDGEFRLGEGERARSVRVRGTADRVDLLSDGTLRVIDYKTGRAPRKSEAVQLAVYGYCAEQLLDGVRGRRWRVGQAGYLAFAEASAWSPVVGAPADRDEVLGVGAARFLEAADGIASGDFPPRPAQARLCATCAFAAVCRKDIVDDQE